MFNACVVPFSRHSTEDRRKKTPMINNERNNNNTEIQPEIKCDKMKFSNTSSQLVCAFCMCLRLCICVKQWRGLYYSFSIINIFCCCCCSFRFSIHRWFSWCHRLWRVHTAHTHQIRNLFRVYSIATFAESMCRAHTIPIDSSHTTHRLVQNKRKKRDIQTHRQSGPIDDDDGYINDKTEKITCITQFNRFFVRIKCIECRTEIERSWKCSGTATRLQTISQQTC